MQSFQRIIRLIQESCSFQHLSIISFYQCFVLLAFFHLVKAEIDISMYNSNMFPGNNISSVDKIVAFADTNGDRFTDIFYVSNGGTQLNVMLVENNSVYREYAIARLDNYATRQNYTIRSVLLYAGKSRANKITLISSQVNGPYKAFYSEYVEGMLQTGKLSLRNSFATFAQMPLIFYHNQDLTPELLAIDFRDRKWKVWQKKEFNFDIVESLDKLDNEVKLDYKNRPIYSLFFDFHVNYSSGVMLTDYAHRSFKFYKRSSLSRVIDFEKPCKEINFPAYAVELAEPIVADWWLEDGVGLLLAYCTAINCLDGITKLAVYNLKNGTDWMDVSVQGDFRLTTKRVNNKPVSHPLIATMRTMDLNGDNYPDIVTTLMDKNNNSFMGVLVNKNSHGRLTFNVKQFKNVHASEVIPFDFMENGVPDLLVYHEKAMKLYKTKFEENEDHDTKFLKVSVTPGRCLKGRCLLRSRRSVTPQSYTLTNRKPMGGVTISLKVRKTNGETVRIRGSMVSSSSYSASQLPFYWFGLSKDINQIHSLIISLPWGSPSVCYLYAVDLNVYVVLDPTYPFIPSKWSIKVYEVAPANIYSTMVYMPSTSFNNSHNLSTKALHKQNFHAIPTKIRRSLFMFAAIFVVVIALNVLVMVVLLQCSKRLYALLTSDKEMKYKKVFN